MVEASWWVGIIVNPLIGFKKDQFELWYDFIFSNSISESNYKKHNINMRLKYLNRFGLAESE